MSEETLTESSVGMIQFEFNSETEIVNESIDNISLDQVQYAVAKLMYLMVSNVEEQHREMMVNETFMILDSMMNETNGQPDEDAAND